MAGIPVLELGADAEIKKYNLNEIKREVETLGNNDPTLSLQSLSPEEQKVVLDFKDKIDIADSAIVMQYGAAAQNKIAQFSDSVLQNVKTKDLGVIGKDLGELVTEIKGFDADFNDDGGFFGLFKNASKEISKLMAGYNKVEVNIDKIVQGLEQHQRILMKDVSMLDNMYKNNVDYFKELSLYIVAGQERLKEFREVDIAKQRQVAESTADEMAVQKLNDMAELANRFEKKLHDLKLSRIISIQMAPQIRILQNNDTQLIEKIQSSIVNAIPLWKNQMVISLGLANSKAALAAQSKVTDMTNELLVKNSEMLKQGSIEVAKESERSLVSIETLRATNENLITTINSVMEIQRDGSAKRLEAEAEIAKIEGDLKRALLEASKSRTSTTPITTTTTTK